MFIKQSTCNTPKKLKKKKKKKIVAYGPGFPSYFNGKLDPTSYPNTTPFRAVSPQIF